MSDAYTIEESRELLRAIFPKYPDLRGMKPVPDPIEFLRELRKAETCKSTST